MVAGNQDRLMTSREAGQYLRLDARSLEGWRSRGYGPRYFRYSRRCVRYRQSDLDDWLEKHSVKALDEISG